MSTHTHHDPTTSPPPPPPHRTPRLPHHTQLVSASKLGINVREVAVKWEEIDGSKVRHTTHSPSLPSDTPPHPLATRQRPQVTVKSMIRMGMELLLTCFCVRAGLWSIADDIDITE